MKKWLIRQIIIPWLRDRALVLPQRTREEIADRLRVDVAMVAAIEQMIRERILQELEGI